MTAESVSAEPGPGAASAVGEFRRGWRVLAGATLGVSLGVSALPFYTAGVFVGPLEQAFGWSREQLALGALASTLTVAAASPFVGALVDRFGVRRPGVAALVCLSLAFLLLSRMPGGFGVYLGLQFGLALTAAASSPLSFTRAVNAWFDRAKGLALGITLAGMGVTAALAPRLLSGVVAEDGWRAGYLALAAAAGLAVPAVWLLLGSRGDSVGAAQAAGGPVSGVGEALRSGVFWRLAAAFALLSTAVAGFVLHFIPMLTDAGVDPARAAGIQGLLGLSVLGGRLVTGALIDRFFAPRVAALLITLSAAGVAFLAAGDAAAAPVAAIALGFALGAEVDLIGYMTARYFGLAAYGRLYGVLYAAFIAGAGLSPVAIAALATAAGYPAALWASAAGLVLTALLFVTAPPFPKHGLTLKKP